MPEDIKSLLATEDAMKDSLISKKEDLISALTESVRLLKNTCEVLKTQVSTLQEIRDLQHKQLVEICIKLDATTYAEAMENLALLLKKSKDF